MKGARRPAHEGFMAHQRRWERKPEGGMKAIRQEENQSLKKRGGPQQNANKTPQNAGEKKHCAEHSTPGALKVRRTPTTREGGKENLREEREPSERKRTKPSKSTAVHSRTHIIHRKTRKK